MVDHEENARIEGAGGKTFIVYSDVECLQAHMNDFAAEDAKVIEAFCNGIGKAADLPIPVEKAPALFTLFDRMKIAYRMMPFLKFWRTWRGGTVLDFARRFKNRFLREVFPFAVNLQHPPEFPMLAFLTTLA